MEWFWVEPSGDRGGFWTDDDLEAEQQRKAGRVVLTAVDGHVEGVEGCAHRADVMRLTARVWGLELTLGSLLSNLQHGLEDIGGPSSMLPDGGEDA